jgi:hypothetical protein
VAAFDRFPDQTGTKDVEKEQVEAGASSIERTSQA